MKLNYFILVIITGIFALACSKYKNIEYHFTALSLNHLNNSGAYPEITAADSLPAKVYGIRLNFHPTIDSETNESFSAEKSKAINTNTIVAINITSTDSFDLIPPGSCLNQKFIYYKNLYGLFDAIDCGSSLTPTLYYSPDYKTQKKVPSYSDILLKEYPSKFRKQRFIIKLIMEDGTEFKDSTRLIKLY